MADERAFIAQVEAASPDELARLLSHPALDEEKALRAYLGEDRYQRLHSLALKRNVVRGAGHQPKGSCIIIHGIMGGELSVSSGGAGDILWLNAFRLMRGWLDRLKLNAEGNSEENQKFKVRASGIMKRYYGELVLSLAQDWNVYTFFFDWRKDLDLAADMLNVQVRAWLGEKKPFHIVAHSMGGLVARTFTKKYRARWDAAWDEKDGKAAGGRLVMLGTPNYGSFAIPQTIVGLEGIVKKLAFIDVRHNPQQVLDTINSFTGPYQMLPSPEINESWSRLYKAETYSRFSVPQPHLESARRHHEFLSDEIDVDEQRRRMIYVAGDGQPTFSNINKWEKLEEIDSYDITLAGDGRVPHALGLMKRDGKSVPAYFIQENHGNLSSNKTVLSALGELLETGETAILKTQPDASRAAVSEEDLKKQVEKQWEDDEKQLQMSLRRMRTRNVTVVSTVVNVNGEEKSMEESLKPEQISPEENRIAETLTRGLLSSRGDRQSESEKIEAERDASEKAVLEVGLAWGNIEKIHERKNIAGVKELPIDAIAVGHYINVQPQAAELALDKSISLALLGQDPDDKKFKIDNTDLILTQYTNRGIIHGKLGQPFFMTDPRPLKNRRRKSAERVIAIAGMGEPGLFGSPELTVLARELCWSLGRLKKKHLATVIIGSGTGNIPLREAISAWMDGARRALTASKFDEGKRLRRITFVEFDPRKIREIDDLLKKELEVQRKQGLGVHYDEWSAEHLDSLKKIELEWDRYDWERRSRKVDDYENTPPTRLTLSLDEAKKTYRFGAISSDASVPEREVKVDPLLVMKANDELAGEDEPPMQLERGRFLEGLLMPDELRRHLYTNAPLVMMLDATTARIHWEMVSQPELTGTPVAAEANAEAGSVEFEFKNNFLGTTRGLTRQLRTTFAPPPEPPPPPQRVLRVLVVADPAADAHLEGAEEEGAAVADLFESYNTVYAERAAETRTQVVRLFGPFEAKRTNVLRELMSRPYDVLHFAGHCVYKWDGDSTASGWIFHKEPKELLSADELNRIDRIPKFVFSNACESGITPDRSGERTAELAPSFAEAFFARGVSNFVCTAWPVDDLAAREFALKLYGRLLGIEVTKDNRYIKADARPMYLALRDARVLIASTDNGVKTWGAYQHYGNPFFQFFSVQNTGSGT
ncbi:MAG: CHAT domain-containing protein [Pyrinomonadaceae bacterium]